MKRICGRIVLASRRFGEHIVIERDYDGFYLKRVFNASESQCSHVSYDVKRKNEWQYTDIYSHDWLNKIKSDLLNIGYKIDWDAFSYLLKQKEFNWSG